LFGETFDYAQSSGRRELSNLKRTNDFPSSFLSLPGWVGSGPFFSFFKFSNVRRKSRRTDGVRVELHGSRKAARFARLKRNVAQERRKDLTDYRDESTFSFDPSRIPVKQLQDRENRVAKKKLDGRKGVLLSSVTRKRKKSRRRRPPPSQQQHQQRRCAGVETDPETTTAAVDESATPRPDGGATISADDDSAGSSRRSSTTCRKPNVSPPRPAANPLDDTRSPQPDIPPPQPEPPPTAAASTTAKSMAAADTLRPCASQGEYRFSGPYTV